MWQGQCRDAKIGEALDGKPAKMHEWVWYWGATRPYKETGDWAKFGALGQLIGPGNMKNGADRGKPLAGMTPSEKDTKDNEDNKLPWMIMHIPGNMQYVQVKRVNHRPPQAWEKPPFSTEAQAEMAKYQFGLHGDLIAGMGMMSPCDKMGRILTASDGTFCEDDQACVTALPADFSKNTGKFCWHWFTPECKKVECPPPKYCPPPPKGPLGKNGQPLHPVHNNCPVPKPCPKQPPCDKPYWQDVCKVNAGQPWCVPGHVLKKYRGPLEIQCSATGNDLRTKKGSPDGCWWLNKNSREDLQRLPGKINRHYAPEGGWFVKHENGALSEKQAETWIQTGKIPDNPKDNSEFLKKAKAPKKVNTRTQNEAAAAQA